MNELLSKSLAQIVNTDHRAAKVFEKYHLDFCCKGDRPLELACIEKKLPADKVITDLEKTSSALCSIPVNYDRFTLTQLADYIVATHHTYIKKEMNPLSNYLQKIVAKHGDRHPEMYKVQALFTAVKEEMEQHMEKEELILFPRIKKIEKLLSEGTDMTFDNNYLLIPVNIMEQEHHHAGALFDEIRKLTGDFIPPPDACTTYRLSFDILKAFELDLHQHIHLENNILFPKALKLFAQSQVGSLN